MLVVEHDMHIVRLIARKVTVLHQGQVLAEGPLAEVVENETVRQTRRNLAPSMRMNADLGDWDRSLLNVQVGQSGQILSSHYHDEWMDHYYARSYPMQFRAVQAAGTLEFRAHGAVHE